MSWDQIDHPWSPLRVAIRTEYTRWFIYGEVKRSMSFQRLTIDRDLRGVSIDLDAHLCNRLAIDLDAAIGNELVHLTAGPQSCGSQKFIDALFSGKYGRRFSARPLWLGHGDTINQIKNQKTRSCNRSKIGWQRLTTQQL